MDTEREMFNLIEAWEKSGQKQPYFCATHGVSLSRFGYPDESGCTIGEPNGWH